MNDIDFLLEFLPSRQGYEQNIPVAEAERLGVQPCGDEQNGFQVYKFLARERVMLTYHREGDMLIHQATEPLHD